MASKCDHCPAPLTGNAAERHWGSGEEGETAKRPHAHPYGEKPPAPFHAVALGFVGNDWPSLSSFRARSMAGSSCPT